jgi:hypothetical protein
MARPNRPSLVPKTLDELRGPSRGVVELSQRLMWNPSRTFDLDNHDLLLWMYENVPREAIRLDELRRWKPGSHSSAPWHDLRRRRGVLSGSRPHCSRRGSRHHRPVMMDVGHAGLEQDDILEVGHYLDRLDDGRFAYYGLSPAMIAVLRQHLQSWPR